MRTVGIKSEVKINVGDSMVKSLKKMTALIGNSSVERKRIMKLKWVNTMLEYTSKFTHEITGTLRKHPQKADVNFKVNQK